MCSIDQPVKRSQWSCGDHRVCIRYVSIVLRIASIRESTGQFSFCRELITSIQIQLMKLIAGCRTHYLIDAPGTGKGLEIDTVIPFMEEGAEVGSRYMSLIAFPIQRQIECISLIVGGIWQDRDCFANDTDGRGIRHRAKARQFCAGLIQMVEVEFDIPLRIQVEPGTDRPILSGGGYIHLVGSRVDRCKCGRSIGTHGGVPAAVVLTTGTPPGTKLA